MKNFLRLIVFGVLVSVTQTICAATAPIFAITPSITTVYLRSDGFTYIPYAVTNKTKTTLSNITIHPAFNTSAHLSINNNTCTNLGSGATCTFNLVLSGQGQPGTFTVSPQICAFNETICSQPEASARLKVNIYAISHPTHAFLGLMNGSVVPVTLQPGGPGFLGTTILGFSLNEPAGIVVNLAGTQAYVTNSGVNTSGVNTISVINTITNQIAATYTVGNVPAAITISPDGGVLYVVNYNNGQINGTLSVLNSGTGASIATVAIGNGPWGIAITPQGSKLYITNSYDNSVSVVNTSNNSVATTIAVGTSPLGIAASPDGNRVYVANTLSNSVSVIDVNTNQVINTISLGAASSGMPKGIAVSPDNTTLYVTDWQNNLVNVISTSSYQVTASVNVPAGPLGLALSPDGTALYVTLDQVNAVAVMNTGNKTVQYLTTDAPEVTMGNFIG